MFRKINNVFRPNHHGHRGLDYHSACTVRLVRSTSMMVVGERSRAAASSTLKRSKSTVSIESTLCYRHTQEDMVWLYSQNRNCLEYLEALVALRRRYTKIVSDAKKMPAPPPSKEGETPQYSAPPVPDEEDTLRYFDAVIASCDSEAVRKPYMDDGHSDVDFIVASSSADHDLHSNWVLRVPRATKDPEQKEGQDCATQKNRIKSGSTSSRRRLQRNPIHLPKAVESALQTLRFKPKLKKH